jgi:hypothetical protein
MRACGCKYQREAKWGYEVQKWVGGKKFWEFVAKVTYIEDAARAASDYPFVLVRCRGCGAEIKRTVPK